MTMIAKTLPSLAKEFDAFLVDQFGVLLDGKRAYPWAIPALSALSASGKPLIILSNSGKRSAPNAKRLASLGFDPGSFRLVLSSGEAGYRYLAQMDLPKAAPIWLHARDGDQSAIDGLGLSLVARPEEADLLILAGSQADRMEMGDYETLLAPAAARSISMLCLNPDAEMLTPLGKRPGAGQIAALYEKLGGKVDWIGKPHSLIYEKAKELLPDIPPARVLCIGDSPAHDILGGQRAGFATALVQTGVHAALSAADVEALCHSAGAFPDFILNRFEWRD